jgi:hypothetical protein
MRRLVVALILLIAVAGGVVLLARPGAEASPDATITVNSAADPGDGIADIAMVWANVYHPGGSPKHDTFTCQAAESDVSCALAKNEYPTVPIHLDTAETVAVGIQNAGGAQDVHVELDLVSPVSPVACPAEWDAATLPSGGEVDTKIVGANQISRAWWDETGMGASELRTRNVDYIVNCNASPPTYPLEIVEDVSGASFPDPNMMNNTCENHPVVTGAPTPTPTPTPTPSPVGGVAELPPMAGIDGAPAHSYAIAAVLAFVAVVAFAAGGWYARRRSLR